MLDFMLPSRSTPTLFKGAPMNRCIALLFSLLIIPICFAQNTDTQPPKAETKREVEIANARVVNVFKIEDEGYTNNSYQVIYHGQDVIVADPIHTTNYVVGDLIYFMVMRHDMSKDRPGGKKLLNFIIR